MSAHAAHREAGGGCEPGGGGLTVERHVLDRLASDAPDQHADDDARPRGSAFFLNMGDAHPGADAFFSVLQELGAQRGVAGQPECLRRGHRRSAAACRRRGAPSSSRTASLHQFTSVVAAGAFAGRAFFGARHDGTRRASARGHGWLGGGALPGAPLALGGTLRLPLARFARAETGSRAVAGDRRLYAQHAKAAATAKEPFCATLRFEYGRRKRSPPSCCCLGAGLPGARGCKSLATDLGDTDAF